MRPKHIIRTALLAALFASSGAATATDDYVTSKKIEPASFSQLVDILAEEMEADGRFAYVLAEERAAINAALARMQQTLQGKRSLGELDEAERVAVFNSQTEINAILTKRDNERVICDQRIIVGSHRKLTVCETYGERMARIKDSKETMDDLNRRVQQCRETTVPGSAANSGGAGVQCNSG